MLKEVMSRLTEAVPVDKEDEILLEGEYDGIQELDNRLPPWWTWFFASTIVFAYAYIFYYHTFSMGDLQTAEYQKEVAVAEAHIAEVMERKYSKINAETVVPLEDEKSLASGKELFMTHCKACHAKDGGGGVGPNLTDAHWLHGCDMKSVFSTISNGVPIKGMISWKTKLNPLQIQEVTSYVLTLKGASTEKPIEPQGEICAK